ncbi:hypothetical protein SAMN04488063_0618 [Halopelagius inordinatus]|uniref:Apea-like HEPN domain-containing protein n=2 Tax=Halopelagius inordinatus TaxID=553467 RepID=A0A1I2M9H7_9EURY|nr:hypothetical protein SAMN04488063_0618 [Halopelagius inordinatus]
MTYTDIIKRYTHYVNNFSNEVGTFGEEPTAERLQEKGNYSLIGISTPLSRKCLLENNSDSPGIRDLSTETLSLLAVALTRLLRIQIADDHIEYWDYTTERISEWDNSSRIPSLVLNIKLINDLRRIKQTENTERDSESLERVVQYGPTVSLYLVYPTLEGLIKYICREDIEMNGEVKKGGKIRKLGPKSDPEYYEEEKVSSIGSLLWHLEMEEGDDIERTALKEMRKKIGELWDIDEDCVYGWIGSNRNESVHGTERPGTEYSTMMNLICLVSWIIIQRET